MPAASERASTCKKRASLSGRLKPTRRGTRVTTQIHLGVAARCGAIYYVTGLGTAGLPSAPEVPCALRQLRLVPDPDLLLLTKPHGKARKRLLIKRLRRSRSELSGRFRRSSFVVRGSVLTELTAAFRRSL